MLNVSAILETFHDWIVDKELVKAWGPIIIGILALVFSFISQIIVLKSQNKQFKRQNTINLQQLNLARHKDERADILNKLNTFYGPFKQFRTQSVTLYRRFAVEHRETDKSFRTLLFLIQGKKFNDLDNQLLGQIIDINKDLLKLIELSVGVVDKTQLQQLLGNFATHTRILSLAYTGEIKGKSTMYSDIIFPRELDGAIESAILRLQDILKEIYLEDIADGIVQKDKETDSTILYYDKYADEYAKKTMYTDLKHLYSKFEPSLTMGSRLLDAGCGAGRDTRYFVRKGYIVIAFDASEGMVRKCNEYPHAYCTLMRFKEMKFEEEFDGIWACASILHLEQVMAVKVISKLATALKPEGIMFVSVKKGQGSKLEKETGRFYQYYNDSNIDCLYNSDDRLELDHKWETISSNEDGSNKTEWINLLIRRK